MKAGAMVVLALAAVTLGCSPEDDIAFDEALVDFSGDYSVTVTNGDNGCGFNDWVEGQANTNIPLKVVDDDGQVTATVEGIPGALLGLLHGSNEFNGSTTGSRLSMSIDGTIPTTQGNCTFTWSNDATATLDGDYLDGRLVYSPAHNGNPDCASVTCQTVQLFNGTRPKRVP
jgi:hypothetical protein